MRIGQALQEVPRQAKVGLIAGWILGAAAAVPLACLDPEPFECETDAQCNLDGEAGRCQDAGYCAYEDDECDSGFRYSLDAPEELAGECTE